VDFAKNLRKARKKLQISQATLASRIGVRQSTIGMWETGAREPKLSDLETIAVALKTTPEELIK